MSTTPAPWSVERTKDHGAAYRVMDEQEVTVALFYQQPFDTWLAKDNARLCAAAFDLLQCVEGFIDAWGKDVARDLPINGGDAVDWISGAMLEFKVAAAKARGK